jgi:hypothetical protein
VLSREYLINLKKCCGEGCHMCPYIPKNIIGSTEISQEPEDCTSIELSNIVK